jgi:hypothetical protein
MSLLTTAPGAPAGANLSQASAPGSAPDTAGTRDLVAEATPENAGRRNPETTNKHKAEVNALLDAYEKKQAQRAREAASKPEPEPEGMREGESWDSVYASQPPEVQRAMAEMRKAMTRKTQDLSRERKALEAQQQALANSGLLDSLAKQAGQMPQDFDPFNPEHIQAAIDAKVAQRLKEVLEPINTQHKQREAVTRYESFKADHPDLVSDPGVKSGVFAALQADKSLSLEAAYWMVKGKKLDTQTKEQAAKEEIRKRALKQAAVIGGTGGKPGRQVVEPDLKGRSAWDIYQTLKNARS